VAKGDKRGAISGQMAKIAEQGRAERETSKPHEAMTSQPDKAIEAAPVVEPEPVTQTTTAAVTIHAETPKGAKMSIPAPEVVSRTPKGATMKVAAPQPVEEPAKAKKRSTSLYLSGAASRALNTLAAQQGVRPHRVIDDALRAEFKRHGLDFDALNATD
jgi:hypothetical protein